MKLEDVLQEIGLELKKYSEQLGDDLQGSSIRDFLSSSEKIRDELKRVEEDGRVMRLGIVGEVKAGKTSFLNALLFDGQTVLPKAATPMTAALTRIRYSAVPSARVVFYDSTDWNDFVLVYAERYEKNMEAKYEKYKQELSQRNKTSLLPRWPNERETIGQSPEKQVKALTFEEFERMNREQASEEERACIEVLRMAEERLGPEVSHVLGKEKHIETSGDDHLMDQLKDYVGANGKYTPLVKYTELELNLPALEGIEIIDTPGMNDPVISRGRITKNFLKECDALFLLSYCGQFLGAEDMQVISRMLPEEGIARCVLIGTKMDSAILQYPKRKAGFDEAYMGTRRSCYNQAKENLMQCKNTLIQERLGNAGNPYLTSSLAFSTGRKLEQGIKLDNEEQFLVDNLSRRFPDFFVLAGKLLGLSQIHSIQEKVYPAIRTDKEAIIEESKRRTREGQRGKFLRLLEEISVETRQICKNLQEGDIERLRVKLNEAEERLNRTRVKVNGIFEAASIRVAKTVIPTLQLDVRTEMRNYRGFQVDSKTTTEHHSSTSGVFLWKKTKHWDETVTTHTASVSDVENTIRDFLTASLNLANEAMQKAIQLDYVKEQVMDAVLGAFDTGDRSFDENDILIPVKNALERITVLKVEIKEETYLGLLDQEIAKINCSSGGLYDKGAIINEGIPMLKQAQGRVLGKMAEDICEQIKKQGEAMAEKLEEQAGVFIDEITRKLKGNHDRVSAMIADREMNLAKLDNYLLSLDQGKKQIQEADR